MEVLIFRTDIESIEKVRNLTPIFNYHADILDWSVDLDDVDNVLRIEGTIKLTENEVINLVETKGFNIETLGD